MVLGFKEISDVGCIKGVDDMTLQEFLEDNRNRLIQGYGYEEIKIYDKNWNLIDFWIEEDDPRYQAKILRIQPVNDDSGINRVRVQIDARKGDI